MLDLQDKPRPTSNIIAIIPEEITFEFNLSEVLKESFENYIKVILADIKKRGVVYKKVDDISLESIIHSFKDPSGVMT